MFEKKQFGLPKKRKIFGAKKLFMPLDLKEILGFIQQKLLTQIMQKNISWILMLHGAKLLTVIFFKRML